MTQSTKGTDLANSKLKRHKTVFRKKLQKNEASSFEKSPNNKHIIVNIEPLQAFAYQTLPKEHPLRKLIAAERSQLTPQEYLAKLESWQFLLREIR